MPKILYTILIFIYNIIYLINFKCIIKKQNKKRRKNILSCKNGWLAPHGVNVVTYITSTQKCDDKRYKTFLYNIPAF